uniref:Putative salivary kunitz domain protein n=1 Tax=Ixodes ricinus TaxID=34613 RepID=A0A0K8R8M7_IXORI
MELLKLVVCIFFLDGVYSASIAECNLNHTEGNCIDARLGFYYDRPSNTCKPYLQCSDKGSHFSTEEECKHYCIRAEPDTSSTTPDNSDYYYDYPGGRKPDYQVICSQPRDVGNTCPVRHHGNHRQQRFFYNTSAGDCESFAYRGCGGNENSFLTKLTCQHHCKHVHNEDNNHIDLHHKNYN